MWIVHNACTAVHNSVGTEKCNIHPTGLCMCHNSVMWGHLNPSSYCDVGRFFYRVLNFELKCAGVYSK